ncbi:peptidase M16 [Clostridium tetani]|uniref:Zinc protease n=1 Tax=Clostridium tetani (strain Massachusetts / E88) TaxID=212717 RepID=Q893Q6_CLOTE|nr:pitrilysin family protein [Clostridium tetani]AAO36286.1 zinc protease [Clostridium tetani E88]AVP54290.1 insulinase family protein [Clostridium tetani]KGI37750.1 peptidase M16 [Clostridium tetani]KGI39676.1 peptidase M16 [Clostridium tetani ATCC 9441]KGI44221.1 peptidase M16 [Clostridium tetani]
MKDIKLNNGTKLIYKKIEEHITSFCIGFDGGAIRENGFPYGTAHVVEHMVFKETKNRTECEINSLCDEIFGFQNAMTNYPYVIYYGTTLSEEFHKGVEVFLDIVLNPTFPAKGFREEIDVIKQELKDWKDDNDQYCEDELFYNAFENRRIKELIIGNEHSLNTITLNQIKDFYNKFYKLNNMTISVVSSLEFEKVKEIIEKYLIKKEEKTSIEKVNENYLYELNNPGTFVKIKQGIEGAKIQYVYPIHMLENKEIKAMDVFNFYFGEGTSGILYNIIRTENSLAYDISSFIKNEKGIKLFCIQLSVHKDNINKAIALINKAIEEIKVDKNYFTEDKIKKAIKGIRLKQELRCERSIQLAKDLTCYEIMYGDYKGVFQTEEDYKDIDGYHINKIIRRILNNPSIQIIQ